MNAWILAAFIYLILGAGFVYWLGAKSLRRSRLGFWGAVLLWLPVLIWANIQMYREWRRKRAWAKITAQWLDEEDKAHKDQPDKPGWDKFHDDQRGE